MRGVRGGSHTFRLEARNCSRPASAAQWSCTIPYAIGARIASDYPGRRVRPRSPTVLGFAHDKQTTRSATVGSETLPAVEGHSAPGEETDSSSRGLSIVHNETQTTGRGESGRLARRCHMKAPRRRAASVESLKRTHRSSMSPESDGFPYHLTTSLSFSWSGSSAALRNCMKPGTPPTSSGAFGRQVLPPAAPPLAVDERRAFEVGLAIANRFEEDVAPPVVAAVVGVEEAVDVTLDERLRTDAALYVHVPVPVVVIGRGLAVEALADHELAQMGIGPADHDLE